VKKSIKIIYLINTLLVIGAVVFGYFTKLSFKETKIELNSEQKNNAHVSLIEEPTVNYFNNDIKNLTELVDTSNLIIVGNVIGERQSYKGAIKTKIKVKSIIENKSLLNEVPDEIFVYEPSYFNFDTYISQEGYNLMQNNKEYILFLKHLEAPKGYDYKADELITFIPTSTYYGKFELENEELPQTLSLSLEEEIMYKEIKNQPLLTENTEIITRYNNIRKNIFDNNLLN
jgi:hypothetical protein